DLEDFADVLHLRRTADRARQSIGDAVDVIAPIEMLVDMDQRNGTSPLECPQNRDRNGVVAAQHDRQRTGCKDLAYGLFGATQMALHVQDVGTNVTAIHRADAATVVERPAKIEVIALEAADDAIAGLAHRRRHTALIIGDVLEGIGGAIGDPEKRDVRLQGIEIERELREQKRGVSVLRWHSQSDSSHRSGSSPSVVPG